METTEISRNRKKCIWIIVGVIAALSMIVILVGRVSGGENSLSEQLALGNKYMDELQYDKAIAAFETAIHIDPKCVEAYMGISIAYEKDSEPLKAAMALGLSYAKIGENEEVEQRFNQLIDSYEEVFNAVANGTLNLNGSYSENEFNDFFHVHMADNNKSKTNGDILDLGIDEYTLFGKKLSEWEYSELETYVIENFDAKEQIFLDNGAFTSPYTLYGEDGWTNIADAFIEKDNYDFQQGHISIHKRSGIAFTMNDRIESEDSWNICFDPVSIDYTDEDVSKINYIGMSIRDCVEMICPGVYDKLVAGGDSIKLDGGTFRMYERGNVFVSNGQQKMTFSIDENGMVDELTIYYKY